ncbi:MAG: 3-hydroxyacyl-CoA dehydrogenase family protein [Ktedonobacteraceae bacterium]
MSRQIVGVVGAGVMGVGVAHSLAQAGHRVILLDLSDDILKHAQEEISKNLRMERMFSKSKGPESIDTVVERIAFTTDYAPFADADFVIENVTENWEIKKKVHAQLDAIAPAHAVFAANTSAISITRIGSVTKRPTQVLGMHFMNPVPMKPVVEVIRGYHTSEETIATAQALLASMNKEGIVVKDMPGFVSNRVLMLTVNEAIFLVQDQVATAAEVDKIFRTCFGHKMGPLETADLIGLDTILYSVEVLYESYNDSKYRPCPLLKKMVDAGLYGRKSGQGFYQYK